MPVHHHSNSRTLTYCLTSSSHYVPPSNLLLSLLGDRRCLQKTPSEWLGNGHSISTKTAVAGARTTYPSTNCLQLRRCCFFHCSTSPYTRVTQVSNLWPDSVITFTALYLLRHISNIHYAVKALPLCWFNN